MENCVFCKIIKGEIPSRKIYEDELIEIIMNINPNTNGHLLALPKEHLVNIYDTSNELISHCLDVIREKIYPLLKDKLNCKGLTLAQNNELGQEIKHYHIHLIPRYENDNIKMTNKENIEDIEEIYNKLMD